MDRMFYISNILQRTNLKNIDLKKNLKLVKKSVKIYFADKRWIIFHRKIEFDFYKLIYAAFNQLPLRRRISLVSFILGNDVKLRQLNTSYRSKSEVTDVLSFLYSMDPLIGEVFISYEQVIKGAKRVQGKSVIDYTLHLSLHGFLHLIGYDHNTKEEMKEMEKIKDKILGTFSL